MAASYNHVFCLRMFEGLERAHQPSITKHLWFVVPLALQDQDLLKSCGLRVKEVEGDGACLFRALGLPRGLGGWEVGGIWSKDVNSELEWWSRHGLWTNVDWTNYIITFDRLNQITRHVPLLVRVTIRIITLFVRESLLIFTFTFSVTRWKTNLCFPTLLVTSTLSLGSSTDFWGLPISWPPMNLRLTHLGRSCWTEPVGANPSTNSWLCRL